MGWVKAVNEEKESELLHLSNFYSSTDDNEYEKCLGGSRDPCTLGLWNYTLHDNAWRVLTVLPAFSDDDEVVVVQHLRDDSERSVNSNLQK